VSFQDESLAKGKARPRRGMFLLPSLFTAGNIAAGYFSITQTIESMGGNAQMHLDWAAIAILFAIPFDALDGRIARMTNTTSEFGKELDSLADVIAFGVGLSFPARHAQRGAASSFAAGRGFCQFCVSAVRRLAAGAVQH